MDKETRERFATKYRLKREMIEDIKKTLPPLGMQITERNGKLVMSRGCKPAVTPSN